MLRWTPVIATLLLSFSALANDPLAGLPESVTKIHQALVTNDTCMKDVPDSNEIVDFKDGTKLYLVQCRLYAYNISARGYLVTPDGDVTQVSVLTYNEITEGVEGSLDLMNMNYDAKTGALINAKDDEVRVGRPLRNLDVIPVHHARRGIILRGQCVAGT